MDTQIERLEKLGYEVRLFSSSAIVELGTYIQSIEPQDFLSVTEMLVNAGLTLPKVKDTTIFAWIELLWRISSIQSIRSRVTVSIFLDIKKGAYQKVIKYSQDPASLDAFVQFVEDHDPQKGKRRK